MNRSILALLVCIVLIALAGPALAFDGAGGDVISVCVSPVDQAVAAMSANDLLQNPTEAVPAEAVIYLAVLSDTERGGVVLSGYTCPVAKKSGPSDYNTYTSIPAKRGAPLRYWFMG